VILIKNIYTLNSASDPDQEYIYFIEVENASFRLLHTFRRRKRLLHCVANFWPIDPDQEYIYFMGSEARDPDQEYIHFMGSEKLPSACYILSITLLLRVTGIKNGGQIA